MYHRSSNRLLLCVFILCGVCLVQTSCSSSNGHARDASNVAPLPHAHDASDGVIRPSEAALKAFQVEAAGDVDDTDWMMVPAVVEFRNAAMSAITSPVTGVVQEIFVTEGQNVRKGDPLVAIRSAELIDLQASLEAARARLKLADDTVRRQENLDKQGVAIAADLMQAHTQQQEAQSEVARLRTVLKTIGSQSSRTLTRYAPRDGVVLERRVVVGDTIGPETGSLMFVGDTQALWVVAQIFDGDLERVIEDAPVRIHMPGGLGKKEGRIIRIGEVVDRSMRRAPVWIALDNTHGLRPGMMGQAAVQLRADSSLRLPPTAVLLTEDGTYRVWVEREPGAFEPRNVVVGQTRHGLVEVMSGLAPGERVVVQGALLLDSAASMRL